jgi:D-aminopeptidase
VMITNTHSVGVVHDEVIAWAYEHGIGPYPWSLPVVAETWDGWLNDINGFHVKAADARHAIETAATGPLAEGNVGGGTGMICFGFKGGTGTASRVLPASEGGYTVGVLVQCNTGERKELRIGGVPIGKYVNYPEPYTELGGPHNADTGSIIIVVATDAPLTPTQLDRLCRRATLGLGRVGGTSGDGSGDIFISFTTANPHADLTPRQTKRTATGAPAPVPMRMLPNWALDPVFDATIHATEEAIINAMVGARTMTGRDNHTVYAVPHSLLRRLMREKHAPAAW